MNGRYMDMQNTHKEANSYSEIASLAGITSKYLCMVVDGSKNAGKQLAKVLAEKTGTEPDLWLSGSGTGRKAAISQVLGTGKGLAPSEFEIIMDRLYQIMTRLDRIEGAIELQNNPSVSFEIDEQVKILKDAFATGDKAIIKEAKRMFNED